MHIDPLLEQPPGSGAALEEASERPDWFDRAFTGDGEPPRLPEEPDRRRWGPYGDLQSTVYFLLGLCCGLLIAYSIYHLGGRW